MNRAGKLGHEIGFRQGKLGHEVGFKPRVATGHLWGILSADCNFLLCRTFDLFILAVCVCAQLAMGWWLTDK